MNRPKKKRTNKKEPKLTLESILNNHDEKTIYFDVIVRDYEAFAEFGTNNEGQTSKEPSEEYASSISRIVFYGDIYWDYSPLGDVEIILSNQKFWEERGHTTASRRFMGVARTIYWDETADNLNLWLKLLRVGAAQKHELTMNIEFESFSIQEPERWVDINSWRCKIIRLQSGSNKIAARIEEKASKMI